MPFVIEFSAESERDFELIFDHLFESYLGFGENVEEALDHSMRRVLDIRKAADRLLTFPVRGILCDDILPGVRYMSIDRAI
jgi:plasmid stabilization system protein ParE